MMMKNIVIAILVLAVGALGYLVLRDNTNNEPSGQPADQADSQLTGEADADNRQSSGKTLSLANRGLESLSTDMFDDSSVTTLDVSGNNLTGALPAEIRQMRNLEVLDASDNDLTGIPAELGQLSKLRIADFSNNDISGLPLEIGNLDKLETLDLRGNPNVSEYDISRIQSNIPNAEILTD